MSHRIYNTAQEEDIAIEAFVKAHPFPSHKEMLKRMKKDMMVWAEYGGPNHDAMKECYENMTNKEACAKAGQRIYERGGHQAMEMNYYALLKYGPFRESDDFVIRNAPTFLQWAWDGIGTWQY